ncbi:MAG TPA: CHAP domain-containing protein [Galbitalea sp.]
MSDEQTPNPQANLLAPRDANYAVATPLLPAEPQFSSRRELHEASKNAARHPHGAASKPGGQQSSRKRPSSRTPKLSRKERSLARKLAVTPAVKVGPGKTPAKKQNPALAIVVMLAVCGFVCGVALPAYAFNPVAPGTVEQAAASASSTHLQALKVNATIQQSSVTRDDISATSDAEYKQQQITAAALASYAKVGPHQAGDDYPWATAGNTLSPLGYFYRQCVDFVAWRLNRDAGVTSAPWKWTWHNLTPNGGDASQWKAAWEAHGWATSATPVVGSVAWFTGNHVAYVKSIDGANVVIEEYNGTSSRSYAIRTIAISSVGRFLYPPA